MQNAPTVILSSGLCVANFSSPHQFEFTDGRILEACDPRRTEILSLEIKEEEYSSPCGRYVNISINPQLSLEVIDGLLTLEDIFSVDLFIVPFMLQEVIKGDTVLSRKVTKARVVRMADRIKKIVHHDRFCV